MSTQHRAKGDNLAESGVSRRRFLKITGAAAGIAVVAQLMPGILAKVKGEPANISSEGIPIRLRRWTMVIDLRRCDGCQGINLPPQCTQACIEGHYAPEPMEWIECFEYELPGDGTQFLPAPCQHCQNAPCVNVCPVGATFASPEGVILIDQQRCIGCRLCMAACPYDRRFFNWGVPPLPKEAEYVDYDLDHQIGAKRGTVMKCDMCPDMARAGKLPYCVQGCPTNAIYYGDLEEDLASNGEEVVKVSQFLSNNSAYRLKEDLGTKPRVYYIHGNGKAVGRNPYQRGRKPTVWPWQDKIEGSVTWQRSGR